MATINTDLTLDTISGVFDQDKFYIQFFKKLLDAVIEDDFSKVSRTPKEIENLFKEIKYGSETKIGVQTFIQNEIYDRVFSNSTLYEGLIGTLVDIYSVLYTIVRMRRDITELSIQPDEVVDAYLDSFGFQGKELFNYVQRREIAKVIYWYLRRKGTPAILIKFLDMLGFSYFFISEYELCEVSDPHAGTSYKYCSRLIYEERPEKDAIGFFQVSDYTYEAVREADPLLIKTSSELKSNNYITYPAQSPYYQIGISVTYPDLEYRISAFSNAMIKKLKNDQDNGENIYVCQLSGYSDKTSYIGLVLGYSYILGEYFGLVNNGNSFNSPVFGWNKDITGSTPLEIMYEIEREMKRLFSPISWQPDEEIRDTGKTIYVDGEEQSLLIPKNTIKTRKEDRLKEIEETFYVDKPMYQTYDDMVEDFRIHDPEFKAYIDSILLSKDERVALYDENIDELEKNYNNVLDLMDEILESMEYYIFDTSSFIIPVKNLALSYANAIEILKKLDKYYTPYHAKLLFPQIIWMIRDLPGDIVAIEDNYIRKDAEYHIYDVVWRADNYKVFDNECPEPYAPITDWDVNNDGMPHIPISLKYLEEPFYDRSYLQSNNQLLYSVGYDWRNLTNYPLIIRGEPYQLYTDWDPDILKCVTRSILEDVIRYAKPDYYWYNLIHDVQEELESKKVNIISCTSIITGDGRTKTYKITHNFKTKNVFVTVYDMDTNSDVFPLVEAKNKNYINIYFGSNVESGKQYKVLIMAPSEEDSHPISGQVFKVIDVGYLNNYMFINDLNTKDLFVETHHKINGENVYAGFIRQTDNIVYLTLNNPSPAYNHKYTVSMIAPNNTSLEKQAIFGSYEFTDVNSNIQQEYVIEHNFRTSNILTRVYDMNSNKEVHPLIDRIDVDRLSINFSKTVGSGSYRVILFGVEDKFYKTATPLNDIVGYSDSFICKANTTSYTIQHNLNSLSLFMQVIDKETGEVVKVNFINLDENSFQINLNKVFVRNNIGREFLVHVIGELDITKVITPSTIYNTGFKVFTIKQNPAHLNAKSFNIQHNLNNDKVVVQMYDNYNRKVYGLVKIIDKDTVNVIIGKPLSDNDYIKIAILSLPNKDVELFNFDKIKQSNHFIAMYNQVISYKELLKANSYYIEQSEYNTTNLIQDDGPNTYEIKHNLSTESLIVNVFNDKTKEAIDAYIAINDRNTITIGIDSSSDITDEDYIHVVIIGALRSHIQLDDREIVDVDTINTVSPLQYTEFKVKENEHYLRTHSEQNMRFDLHDDDCVFDGYYSETGHRSNLYINRFDIPCINERVEMIHEIKDSQGIVTTLTSSGEDGFSKYNIRSNDPLWDQSVREDVPRPTLITYNDERWEV